MPRSKVIEVIEDGVRRRLGTLLPDQFPVARAARDAGMVTFTEAEIRTFLEGIPGERGFHNSAMTFDASWRLDQRQSSGCNGNSTAGALAEQLFNSTGIKTLLSGGDAYSQMNGGVDEGSVLSDGMKVVTNGIAPLSLCDNATIFTRDISQQAKAARALYRGHEPLGIDSENELATFVILYRVAIIAVQAGGSFSRLDRHGVSQGDNGPGNHSVFVDDLRLRNGRIEFHMVNSWSANWGQQGRCWLRWADHLRDTVRNHRFWGLPATAMTEAHMPPKPH